MKKLVLTAALSAASLGLSACGGDGGDGNTANGASATEDGNGTASGGGSGGGNGSASGASADGNWPRGTRIVEDNGVTYRVDPDGTRVRLEPSETRIVVENGVRYRVDPGGTRVRIDDRGVDIDLPDVDVDVGVNRKGNPDIDVSTDGNDATPNR